MSMRACRPARLILVALALALVLTAPVLAVGKVVLFEEFGATW